MEKYINNDTLIEDDIAKLFKSTVICPICKNILINPFICLKCQSVYCKKCIDNWSENNEKCPNNCENPEYQKCLGKNEVLSKFKFTCVGCHAEIEYNNAESHHSTCCPEKTSEGFTKRKSKIKRLTSEEAKQLTDKGNEMNYIKGKKINFIYFN